MRSGPARRSGRGYAFAGAPTVPVTIAWGTRDRILPYRQAAVARRHLPHAHHVDLVGCGHVPMHDDPDLVAGVILATTGADQPRPLPEPAGRPVPAQDLPVPTERQGWKR